METFPAMQRLRPGCLLLQAPAKINLSLHVKPLGPDGYHPLDSLVAKVTLCDRIELQRLDEDRVLLDCAGASCGPAEKNLAFRAAELLREQTGGGRGVAIRLEKRIPPGAGLGGGSSDAAAVLAGCNELWGLQRGPGELASLAARLGSDVPLFLGRACSRITGRGEGVEPMEVYPFHAVLVLPELFCSTAEVYRLFDEMGTPSEANLESAVFRQPPSRWRGELLNDLAGPACRLCPQLAELRRELSEATGLPVSVTGSGSGLFLLADDRHQAEEILRQVPPSIRARCRLVQRNPW